MNANAGNHRHRAETAGWHLVERVPTVRSQDTAGAVVQRLPGRHYDYAGTAYLVDDADRLLGAIVGIEIEVTKIVGKSKLSQNREEPDRRGAAEELAKRGKTATSTAMLARDPKLTRELNPNTRDFDAWLRDNAAKITIG